MGMIRNGLFLAGSLGAAALALVVLSDPAASSAAADRALEGRDFPAGPAVPDDAARADLSIVDYATRIGDDQNYDEPYCDHRELVTEKLSSEYGELQIGQPQPVDGLSVELWASDRIGSWSVLATRADGVTCVIDTGEDWQGQTDALALLAE